MVELNGKLFDVENMTTQQRDRGLEIVLENCGEQAEVVLCSLTGSRAFGWGGDRYDMDIHGVIASQGPGWDNMHTGKFGYDISMYNFDVFLMGMRDRWILYENLSNPIFIHKDFDFKGFLSFCCPFHVKHQMGTIEMELHTLRNKETMRKALHCYRQLANSLWFLQTGEVQIDIGKIYEKFEMGEFPKLCEFYKARQLGAKLDWQKIWAELDGLKVQMDQLLEEKQDIFDKERFEEWKQEMVVKFIDYNIRRPNF